MSNQQMAMRLHDLLSEKAAMGMGYDEYDEYGGEGELEDIMEIYGRGVMAGRGSKKAAASNPWVQFLHMYAEENGITYRDALQDPGAKRAYCTFYKKEFPNYFRGKRNMGCIPKKSSTRAAPSRVKKSLAVARAVCPKGYKVVKVKGYTRKNGTKVKRTTRCLKPKRKCAR